MVLCSVILEFDQKVFKNNYAKPFRVIQYVLSIGFVLFILSVIVGVLNLNLTIPDGVNTAIAIYSGISIIGFPFIVLLKKGHILPEEEIVLWEEHLVIPKDEEKKDEENTSSEENDSSNYEGLGSNMNISSYYVRISKGESVMIEIDYPSGYGADDFTWSSADKSIATVKNGRLTAKGIGSTYIKAESKDGKYYASCAVSVGE